MKRPHGLITLSEYGTQVLINNAVSIFNFIFHARGVELSLFMARTNYKIDLDTELNYPGQAARTIQIQIIILINIF